jgi:hypothetical protein
MFVTSTLAEGFSRAGDRLAANADDIMTGADVVREVLPENETATEAFFNASLASISIRANSIAASEIASALWYISGGFATLGIILAGFVTAEAVVRINRRQPSDIGDVPLSKAIEAISDLQRQANDSTKRLVDTKEELGSVQALLSMTAEQRKAVTREVSGGRLARLNPIVGLLGFALAVAGLVFAIVQAD